MIWTIYINIIKVTFSIFIIINKFYTFFFIKEITC